MPVARLAEVVKAQPDDILHLGKSMGLAEPPRITANQQRRSYITVIRRNWHLLPYGQLLALLGWSPEQMAFVLREDDFLYHKLGQLKPRCEPLLYAPPTAETAQRAAAIAAVVRENFPDTASAPGEQLFGFVEELSRPPASAVAAPRSAFAPRFCYSYFALYGEPLLEKAADPYPDGYLARMAAAGVDGVWLQAVLHKLAPFPWDAALSARHEERLANLKTLVVRARKHGIGVYLYLNEPRAMPLAFYESRPQMKGVVEGDFAALCTSDPDVQKYLTSSIATICRAVPDLAGFFTISGSENLTNCWSHHKGDKCPRCGQRAPADVIAELHVLFREGIRQAGSQTRLIAWDWGWSDGWAEGIIGKLPQDVALMSVSEWSIPIKRGGVDSVVGEYSISTVGPGPRATRHWDLARKRGLKALAKIQAGATWELSAVPYIPAVANVAQHAANLRAAGVDGLMLGWSLGGYPSPNLEVVAEVGGGSTPDAAMDKVARRRFGDALAPLVVNAWRDFSAAFSEFPFHIGVVYHAPLQYGPANFLWGEPTGYKSSMVGFPYDDLDGWRAVYPPDVFAAQCEKTADGFESSSITLAAAVEKITISKPQRQSLARELGVAAAAAIHFRSTANQVRFVLARRALAKTDDKRSALAEIKRLLKNEIALACRLCAIQSCDSRIGFEASNHYFYVPQDLIEKVLNCHDLLTRWLPAQRAKV
ncbi:MAG: hypothetical protein NTY53_16765 [Kiritimatiellaeota bacterium]|nr:hypothetical protein [Kiritimatiellota bacterium]